MVVTDRREKTIVYYLQELEKFMTTFRQFAKLRSIKSSIKIVAASSLAVGVAAMIPAAPAHAITFTSGELDFGFSTSAFGSNVSPVAGNTFNVTFNPGGTASILRADGSFSPTFTTGTTVNTNSPIANFVYGGGSTYTLNGDLTFNFAAATPTTFTLGSGSTFTETEIFQNGIRTGAGLQIASPRNVSFLNGSNTTIIPTLAFSLTDTGLPSGGLYIAQASSTAVPEPFTVIGTIIGGTAAFRMRKKLANINKN
ncbi:PEP-CTERM sorting domain-containing protein [Chamaesiphon sp. VAR_69_metabat_338]|uniref:PEP-CTERM sorting domain-containing protein n=1 Tax=Chamaesiphon sp. VAR_69_metabat_338 TaxID=2964704 RepID=UPI0037C00D4E